MDPNAETPPPSVQVAEVDLDSEIQVRAARQRTNPAVTELV